MYNSVSHRWPYVWWVRLCSVSFWIIVWIRLSAGAFFHSVGGRFAGCVLPSLATLQVHAGPLRAANGTTHPQDRHWGMRGGGVLGEGDAAQNILLIDCYQYSSEILKQNKERVVVTVGFLFLKKIKALIGYPCLTGWLLEDRTVSQSSLFRQNAPQGVLLKLCCPVNKWRNWIRERWKECQIQGS